VDTSPISAVGLILDVGGAIALASAFAFKRPRDVYFEASPYYGPNPALVVSMAKQTADAWVGGILLVLGFIGQFDGALGWDPDWACLTVMIPVACGIVLAAFALLLLVLRPRSVGRTIQGVLAAQRHQGRIDEWRAAIIWLARSQGREIKPGELPSDLAVWLMGKKRWQRLTKDVDAPDDVTSPYTSG
jgi:hypothetical protein